MGDTEEVHSFLKGRAERDSFQYFRFNEPEVLADMDFDEWKPRKNGRKSIKKMDHAFSIWAVKPEVVQQLQRCAYQLVRRRRLRVAADPSLWEAFALGSHYDCGRGGCPEPVTRRWYMRREFEQHLRDGHELHEEVLKEQADTHRTIWEYKARQ